MLSRESDPRFAGGWIFHRECSRCGFAGPETEFMAAGLDVAGDVMLMHRDECGPGSVYICTGCAVGLGRTDPTVVRQVVLDLLARMH